MTDNIDNTNSAPSAATNPYSPEAMRSQFALLTAEQARNQETLDKATEEYHTEVKKGEAIIQAAETKYKKLRDDLGMYDRGQSIATLVRALGGKTSEPEIPAEFQNEPEEATTQPEEDVAASETTAATATTTTEA